MKVYCCDTNCNCKPKGTNTCTMTTNQQVCPKDKKVKK